MTKRTLLLMMALLFGTAFTAAQKVSSADATTLTGVIINAGCTVDEAFAEAAKCTDASSGGRVALYDDTTRKLYDLEPQTEAAKHLGDSVRASGTLDGNTLHVSSLDLVTSFGLATGQKAPAFSLPDQHGNPQTLESLRGTRGTVLLFFRSADWCPYCKGQLIQLQAAKERFEKQGIKLAGISYDSPAILKFFSDRRGIEFPLLSDPDSKVIRAYDVLNAEATGEQKGMARPGYFFIDPSGRIGEKFFEAKYRDRLSGNNVIAKLFPELGEEVTAPVDAPHIQLTTGQSDQAAFPGNRVMLTAEVRLPADVHVYAPGAQDYKPIKLIIDPAPEVRLTSAVYPTPKTLYLPAIKDKVPVFEGTFRIQQELQVETASDFSSKLGADGKTVTISGKLEYQACDSKICFFPNSVPVQWQLRIMPLDRQRAPEDIRHH